MHRWGVNRARLNYARLRHNDTPLKTRDAPRTREGGRFFTKTRKGAERRGRTSPRRGSGFPVLGRLVEALVGMAGGTLARSREPLGVREAGRHASHFEPPRGVMPAGLPGRQSVAVLPSAAVSSPNLAKGPGLQKPTVSSRTEWEEGGLGSGPRVPVPGRPPP